jgi:hypothetical protein
MANRANGKVHSRGVLALVSLLLPAVLPACGPEAALGAHDDGEVGQGSQALDAILDTSVVSLGYVTSNWDQYFWAFACDAFGNLKRSVVSRYLTIEPGTEWSTPVDFGQGCVGAPSVITNDVSTLDIPTSNVSVFVTWNDGQLWRLYWTVGYPTYRWENVSSRVGWASVAPLPPVAVYGNEDLSELSVAVRNANNELYTLDLYDGVWHATPVYAGPKLRPYVVVTTHRLSAPPDPERLDRQVSYLTGTTNTPLGGRQGFIASRRFRSRGSFRVGSTMSTDSAPVISTSPNRTEMATYKSGSRIVGKPYDGSGSVAFFGQCAAGGPPTWEHLKSEPYFRGSGGGLFNYAYGTNDGPNIPESYQLLSAQKVKFINSAITQFWSGAYYAGLAGELKHFDSHDGIERDVGIKVLF